MTDDERAEMRSIIQETVRDTLTQLGVEHAQPLEMQKDFQHLRENRLAAEFYSTKIKGTLIGVFTMSVITAVVLGMKEYFSN